MAEGKIIEHKLPKTMPCPYHDCLPVYVKDILIQAHDNFPEVALHRWYCPECYRHGPVPNRRNAFGAGFTSQRSKSAARSNWNRAVHRRQLTILKKAIATGK